MQPLGHDSPLDLRANIILSNVSFRLPLIQFLPKSLTFEDFFYNKAYHY